MKSRTLIGRKLESIRAHLSGEIHSAWPTEVTPNIRATIVFLDFSDAGVVAISPCEVDLPGERYPSLGLKLEMCISSSCRQPDGREVEATLISELSDMLPGAVIKIEESDPLSEGAISQYEIKLDSGDSIFVQHIMPPMTLGISLRNVE